MQLLLILVVNPPWKDPRIHSLGNHGILGNMHAHAAPHITNLIDQKAYCGQNVRKLLHNTNDVVDLGCGVGLSTPKGGIGVDCSKEMIKVAQNTSIFYF